MNELVGSNEKVVINVSGMRFETWPLTLSRFPNTLLGNPYKRRKYFDYIHNEYFFERHRQSFESILFYYQSQGRFLIRPLSVSSEVFFDEIVFFELGEEVINKYKKDEGYLIDREANMNDLPTSKHKRFIWLTFEYPHSSIIARIVAVISLFIITISIALFCIETIPEVKAMRAITPAIGYTSSYPVTTSISSTLTDDASTSSSSYISSSGSSGSGSATTITTTTTTTTTSIQSTTTALSVIDVINSSSGLLIKDEFFIIETICIIWFSIELVMRFYAAPDKFKFIRQVGNIIDFVSIMPYFMQITDTKVKFSLLRIIRLVRVFRIFKLARHFKGLQILAHTLRASANELMLLVFFLLMGVILFSSIVYFVELDDAKSDFDSIPDGFWYAIITMTTVGYGEMVPKTVLGRLIGCLCAIAGVLTIALPVPIIVSHFQFFYQSNQVLKKINKDTLRISNQLGYNNVTSMQHMPAQRHSHNSIHAGISSMHDSTNSIKSNNHNHRGDMLKWIDVKQKKINRSI